MSVPRCLAAAEDTAWLQQKMSAGQIFTIIEGHGQLEYLSHHGKVVLLALIRGDQESCLDFVIIARFYSACKHCRTRHDLRNIERNVNTLCAIVESVCGGVGFGEARGGGRKLK
jgi:hypothetical protein